MGDSLTILSFCFKTFLEYLDKMNFACSKQHCEYHEAYIDHFGHSLECSLHQRIVTVNHSTWTCLLCFQGLVHNSSESLL